jgi:RNA polymerase sigma factor for flagellar operon FliA
MEFDMKSAIKKSGAAGQRVGSKAEEVDRIWASYKATGDPVLRNRLIEEYYPLVRFVSERLAVTLPRSVEVDDLTSAGLFGLMDAIDGFDLSRGIKFKTYCCTRIRGAILDDLRNQDWVPRLVRLKANKIARALKTLEARLGRAPTEAEMAGELDIPVDEFAAMSRESAPTNIYSLSDRCTNAEDDSTENAEVVPDARAPQPSEAIQKRDAIETLTRGLCQKERRIIVMYYYEGLTMREIGRILDLTESRVCQIHGNVMARLREQAAVTEVALAI